MTRAEVEEKCVHLLSPVLGSQGARELTDTVWALDEVGDMRNVGALLRAGDPRRVMIAGLDT
jgi:tRNA G18 (ribose-2'-O)-methylase SpoU